MKFLNIQFGEPGEDIRALLNDNVIGTPGKSLVYQHQRVDAKIDHLREPIFVSVALGGRPVGTLCLVKRRTLHQGQSLESYYLRYFSFRSSLRSAATRPANTARPSALRQEVSSVFSENVLSENPKVFYAYVDPGNVRSRRVIEEYGFSTVGSFRTVFFSRFQPRNHAGFQVLTGEFMSSYLTQLRSMYRDHLFFTEENIGFENGVIGYVEDGEVLAACQANAEYWKVYEIPGSKRLVDMVSMLPWINRLIARDFRFLSMEGIYLRPGYEHLLEPLLESALHLKNRNTAIMCLDPGSWIYPLVKGLKLGFMKYLTAEKQMAVVAKTSSVSIDALAKGPVYVSGFDNM